MRPIGLSAGGPSLPIPPPSTLVGAISAGVSRILGWGEVYRETGKLGGITSTAYRLARHLLAVGARIAGPVAIFREVARYSTLPYQSPDNIKHPGQWFGAQNFGITLAPNTTLEFVLVLDDAVRDLGIDQRILTAAAYSITRVGSKESVAAVDYAESGRAVESTGGETSMYSPLECVDPSTPPSSFYTIEVWDPRSLGAYTRLSPFAPPPLRLAVPGKAFGALQAYTPERGPATITPPLRLRGDCRTYAGPWPEDLGRAASLPLAGSVSRIESPVGVGGL